MAEAVNKSRIAKNTIALYIRMFISMAVGIFTSRVTLEYLGVTDYGVYQSVGGIVGMISFVNTAISTGISRFITFGLGEGNMEKLKKTFSTLFTMQLILATILVVACETIGYWFLSNKLVIPAESLPAAKFAFHLSIITMFLSMMCNPFSAIIMAHERMTIYAYISLINAFATLGASYLLTLVDPSYRLYLYALLLFIISGLNLCFNFFYSIKKFEETSFKIRFDKFLYKDIASFSGWSLFAALSISLNNQGVLVLLNMFFSPVVVAARAISLTVNGCANSLVANFRIAMNPQIVKQYAAGKYDESKRLLIDSTIISFFLMFILSLPICIGANSLLNIWLKEVPEYSVIFLQLVVIQSLFQVFDTSFYTALYAKGDLKLNALISPTLGFVTFPIVYLLFKHGASPVALSWANIILYATLGLIVKPILIIKITNYTWPEILSVFKPCLVVSIVASSLTILATSLVRSDGIMALLLIIAISLCISLPTIYYLGLNKNMRNKINGVIRQKIFGAFICA